MKFSGMNSDCNLKLPCDRCGLWPPHKCQDIAFSWLHTPIFSMLCWPLQMPAVRDLCCLGFYLDAPKTIGCGISSWFVRLLYRVQLARLQTGWDWNMWTLVGANDLFAVQMSTQNLELRFSSPNSNWKKFLIQCWGHTHRNGLFTHIYCNKLSIYLWIITIKWIWPRCSVAWHFRAILWFHTYTLEHFEIGERMQFSLAST